MIESSGGIDFKGAAPSEDVAAYLLDHVVADPREISAIGREVSDGTLDTMAWTREMLRILELPESGYYRFRNKHGK